jgi:hypothetical protein
MDKDNEIDYWFFQVPHSSDMPRNNDWKLLLPTVDDSTSLFTKLREEESQNTFSFLDESDSIGLSSYKL